MDTSDLRDVTLDLTTLTMGEAGLAERESGLPLSAMLASPMTRRLLALFVHISRTSGEPPKWSALSNLRLLDVSPSRSPEPRGNPSAKSNASRSMRRSTSSASVAKRQSR